MQCAQSADIVLEYLFLFDFAFLLLQIGMSHHHQHRSATTSSDSTSSDDCYSEDYSSESDTEFVNWLDRLVQKLCVKKRTSRSQLEVPETKVYACNLCKKEFALESLLAVHQIRHTGEISSRCVGNFSNHAIFLDVNPYKCTHCSSSFKWKILLQHHVNECRSVTKVNTIQKRVIRKDKFSLSPSPQQHQSGIKLSTKETSKIANTGKVFQSSSKSKSSRSLSPSSKLPY